MSRQSLAADASQTGFQPGQIERQIESAPPSTLVPAVPSLPKATTTQVDMQDQRFRLAGVLIEGMTVYDNLEFLPLYQPYLGKHISVTELREIADAITRHYQDAGYFLSNAFLPRQTIEFGVVRIRVLEGYIAQWRSSEPGGSATIDELLATVLQQKPLRRLDLIAALRRINGLPGLTVQPQVRALPNEPGAYELILDMDKTHFDGSLSIDNRGTEFIGPLQAVLSVRALNLSGRHEVYQLRLARSDETEELQYIDASTEWLVGSQGLRIQASATHTDAEPGGELQDSDTQIENRRYRLALRYPLIQRPERERHVGAYLNYYHSRTDQLGSKRLEDLLLSVNLNYRENWVSTKSTLQSVNVSLTQGISTDDTRIIDTQAEAGVGTPAFTRLNLNYLHQHKLNEAWQVRSQLDAQYAGNALPASERYSVGGARFGSAYDPSEISGDHGLAVRLDLIYRQGWMLSSTPFMPYGFYDFGSVWLVDARDETRLTAASLGLGVRFGVSNLSAALEAAKPLTRDVASEGDDGERVRLFGSLSYRF